MPERLFWSPSDRHSVNAGHRAQIVRALVSRSRMERVPYLCCSSRVIGSNSSASAGEQAASASTTDGGFGCSLSIVIKSSSFCRRALLLFAAWRSRYSRPCFRAFSLRHSVHTRGGGLGSLCLPLPHMPLTRVYGRTQPRSLRHSVQMRDRPTEAL